MFGIALAVVHSLLQALPLPQDVRHRRTRQHQVVDAGRPARIDVKRFQEGIDVVGAAAAGDQRQVRRRDPEPARRVLRAHIDLHGVVDALAGEHQVLDHLLLRQAEVGADSAVAHVARRVTAHAVIDEVARATLQRRDIGDVVARGLDDAGRRFRGVGVCAGQQRKHRERYPLLVSEHDRSPAPAPASSGPLWCTTASG
jgi:hypothetical protein